jgi:hypothetical protein
LTEFRTCFTHSSRIFNNRANVVAENNPHCKAAFKSVPQNRAEMLAILDRWKFSVG